MMNLMMRRRVDFPYTAILSLVSILAAVLLLFVQLGSFSQARQRMPAGLIMAGVPVGGLTRTEAQAQVEEVYGSPITLHYRDSTILLDPAAVGFRIDSEAMLSRADALRTEGAFWPGFWDYLWRRPEGGYSVDLVMEYSEDLMNAYLADIAARYDRPPVPAQPVLNTLSFQAGSPGYTLDIESSAAAIAEVLRQPTGRTVDLAIDEGQSPEPSLDTLRDLIVTYLDQQEYRGLASVYVIDLQTGEEMALNVDFNRVEPMFYDYDVAYAGMSVMKIPIMVEMYRYMDWAPYPNEWEILTETMTLSGNFTANLMLEEIGDGDGWAGADIVTRSMRYLGLDNTFIAAPYDEEEEPPYISTPARECARSGQCVDTYADIYMQTTPRDMAILLDMIYQCAEYGGGGLMSAYPGDFTQTECQSMIDLMAANVEGVLILAGVPEEGTIVAHKHGWISDTHADAGIVLSPGGDYVLAMFMWDDVDWLDYQISFPLMAGISQATFNYFNPDLIMVPRRGFEPQQ
jgi:beta-lactamase class A